MNLSTQRFNKSMVNTIGFMSLFFLGFFLFSCGEDEITANTIVGEWQWVKSEGVWSSSSPETSNTTQSLHFTVDGDYSSFNNDTLNVESTYSVFDSLEYQFLKVDAYTFPRVYLINSDTLIMSSVHVVGLPVDVYVKK